MGSLVNYELELLNTAAAQGAGIFACEQWDVFSDVSVRIDGTGYDTIVVEDKLGEFHQLKREDSGTWVNWGMFYQVWIKIREVGKWKAADYTIKLDADAVFIPQRLKTWLSSKPGESPHGLYYENCPNVQYGFFGHLEIISKTAVKVLTANLEECHTVFAPCANDGCDWKFGAWITTTSTRSRLSMWPQMARAKQTGPRERKVIRSGIQKTARSLRQ